MNKNEVVFFVCNFYFYFLWLEGKTHEDNLLLPFTKKLVQEPKEIRQYMKNEYRPGRPFIFSAFSLANQMQVL